MGSGRSGIYYTTHGSRMIHHKALIHSLEGDYTTPSKEGVPIRLKSDGHGQAAISNSKGSKKRFTYQIRPYKILQILQRRSSCNAKRAENFSKYF